MKVSLVLISKNEEKHARKFFEYLKKQTRKPDEIILVDSSEDKTAKIAKPFVDKLIKTPTTCQAHARSIGIKISKGDIIVFTDIDAIPHPNWLEELVKPFKNPEVNVVQGQVFLKSYNGHGEKWLFTTGLKEWGKYLNHCNTAYRRKVLEEIPFDVNTVWDDPDMGYRVSKKYPIYGCKKAKVYHYDPRANLFIERGDEYLWKATLRLSYGWVYLIKKYKNSYWVLRSIYNIFSAAREGSFKIFVYYSAAFSYVIFLEIIGRSPSQFKKQLNLKYKSE